MGYFHNRLTKTYICDTIYATAKFFTKRYIFYVSDFCAWCAENIPSKERCMCFFILKRRVQRYRTAVRGARIKNTYTDGTSFLRPK